MKEDQQQIEIAEACGFTWKYEPVHAEDGSESGYWYRIRCPDGEEHCVYNLEEGLPDYPNDLNAMAQAEMWLRKAIYNRWSLYVLYLNRTFGPCATAGQRAKTFLRTIDKWREAK